MKTIHEQVERLLEENANLKAIIRHERAAHQRESRERAREARGLSKALERKSAELRAKDRELAETWKRHREAMAKAGLNVKGEPVASAQVDVVENLQAGRGGICFGCGKVVGTPHEDRCISKRNGHAAIGGTPI